MNIWDDAWGEQDEDWSGGGALAKRLVDRGPLRLHLQVLVVCELNLLLHVGECEGTTRAACEV